MTQKEFAGSVALVTGGSRGIGRAICVELARSGARVAVNYLKDDVAARSTLEGIEAVGGSGGIYGADVCDESAVDRMKKDIEKSLGPIDILVTSAGIVESQDHAKLAVQTYRKVMATNVDGTFVPIMAVKDGMIERGFGNIVCISSIAGLRARPRMIAYSISKAAVIGLVRSCAAAFGPAVRVNGIAPGLIETDMTAEMDARLKDDMREEAFVKRLGVPNDIAGTVLYLLSSGASFISGQTFVVDGGRVTLP
jgi:3-oxoacyl-[acyl-carrier protein] reductase